MPKNTIQIEAPNKTLQKSPSTQLFARTVWVVVNTAMPMLFIFFFFVTVHSHESG